MTISVPARHMAAVQCYALLCANIFAHTSTYAAGFNCGRALQPDEKAVCADGVLSKLDDELNIAYKKLLSADPSVADKERRNQRAFLVNRRGCSTDTQCIRSLYDARLGQLNAAAGLEIFEPERQPQSSKLVDQAQKLLALSLRCPSKPIQEGARLFYKVAYESIGDRTTLRVKQTVHIFEGLKFAEEPYQADSTISGVNAATTSIVETTFSAPLNAITRVEISRGSDMTVLCDGHKQCVNFAISSYDTSCQTFKGQACNDARTIRPDTETRMDSIINFEAICHSQIRNTAEALRILISAAKYGQVD
jgi:uncharacterized protein